MPRIPQPDFSLSDPQRAEFEKRYRGKKRPHFGGGDISECRPMTKLEWEQYRDYLRSRGLPVGDREYQNPF